MEKLETEKYNQEEKLRNLKKEKKNARDRKAIEIKKELKKVRIIKVEKIKSKSRTFMKSPKNLSIH